MQRARNIKTGNEYVITGMAMNATNDRNGQNMVIYAGGGAVYVRELDEFMQKFEVIQEKGNDPKSV